MRRRLGSAVLALGPIAAIVAASACRSPTQITVRVTTAFACSDLSNDTVSLSAGAAPGANIAQTISTDCHDGYVGSVVLVPSDHGDRVAIEVIAALSPRALDADGKCAEGSDGRIHARRSIAFIPHTPLLVPIELEKSCAGVTCDPRDTCFQGGCKSATIDSPDRQSSNGCGVPKQPPNGSSPDGGAPDASPDASPDAPHDAPSDSPSDGAVTSPVAGCDMRALQKNAPWPMEGYCPGHRRKSPLAGPPKGALKQLWHYTTTARVMAAAIDANGDVYFGTYWNGAPTGEIHAVRGSDGKAKWGPLTGASVQAGHYEEPPVIAADGTLYVVNGAQTIAGYSSATGSITRGPLSFPDSLRSGLTIDGAGNLYASDSLSHVQSATPALAARPSVAATSAVDLSTPAIDPNGTLFVAASDGTVNAIDTSSMTYLWNVSVATNALGTDPIVAPDGTLRLIGYQDRVVAQVNPSSKTRPWTKTLGAAPQWIAIDDDGTTYVGTEGHAVQVFGAGGADAGAPLVGEAWGVIDANGTLYTWESGGFIHAYPRTGQPWTYPFTASGVWSIAIGFGNTLILTAEDGVYALAPDP